MGINALKQELLLFVTTEMSPCEIGRDGETGRYSLLILALFPFARLNENSRSPLCGQTERNMKTKSEFHLPFHGSLENSHPLLVHGALGFDSAVGTELVQTRHQHLAMRLCFGGMLVGQLFGVATNDAALAADVALDLTGVFELTKIGSQAWAVGALIYWDDTNKRCTTVATGNLLIGVAAAAVAGGASNTTGRVRLNASFRANDP